MKVALPTNNGKKKETPPLSLIPEKVTEENDLKLAKFKLRTEPAWADSPTYSFALVKLDGSETLRTGLGFYISVAKVFVELNITTR